jgi:hypothetical protein
MDLTFVYYKFILSSREQVIIEFLYFWTNIGISESLKSKKRR